jgi:hypothetical protein
MRYKSLAVKGVWIGFYSCFLLLLLKKIQPQRLWEWGNPVGISKECGKSGKPALGLSMLSILCHCVPCMFDSLRVKVPYPT